MSKYMFIAQRALVLLAMLVMAGCLVVEQVTSSFVVQRSAEAVVALASGFGTFVLWRARSDHR